MNSLIRWICLVGVILAVGCETTDKGKVRLSQTEVRSLLLNNTEVGVLRRPSRIIIEGYSGQTYKVHYRDNNIALYKLDDNDDIKNWFWEVRETGVLCRGPSSEQTWCRAITPDGVGSYNANGFRTGILRYQFRVEKGLSGLPKAAIK